MAAGSHGNIRGSNNFGVLDKSLSKLHVHRFNSQLARIRIHNGDFRGDSLVEHRECEIDSNRPGSDDTDFLRSGRGRRSLDLVQQSACGSQSFSLKWLSLLQWCCCCCSHSRLLWLLRLFWFFFWDDWFWGILWPWHNRLWRWRSLLFWWFWNQLLLL